MTRKNDDADREELALLLRDIVDAPAADRTAIAVRYIEAHPESRDEIDRQLELLRLLEAVRGETADLDEDAPELR